MSQLDRPRLGDFSYSSDGGSGLVALGRRPAAPSPDSLSSDPLLAELEKATSARRVLHRPLDVIAYASDASFYRLVPRAVVQPQSEGEIASLFAISRKHRVPLTFRAAGTSLSGQALSDGILVDLSKHWSSVKVLDHGARVRVQPGAIAGKVNAELRSYRRRIGPDPASIDACMMGGVLANNASGMCCGVSENSYHTLQSLRFMLPSGLVLDTSQPGASEQLRSHEPSLYFGLRKLKAQVQASPELVAKIKGKYRIKNTTGYALNALIDFEDPAEILAHLLIGSEGTLGFIAEAVLRTLPDYPLKRTGLLLFATSDEAFEAVSVLADSGARAVEFMDYAALCAVAHLPALGLDVKTLPPSAAALLVEYQAESPEELARLRQAEQHALSQLSPVVRPAFTEDEKARAGLWKIRKGLYPAVGATKRSGETVLIEDVAFPREKQAKAFHGLRALFDQHGYHDAILFGHAKDGNCHFVLKQSFGEPQEVARYERFMDDVVKLVVDAGGSLKAEHGTGRNVAPFVELEWGAQAYGIMAELKALLDPAGLLNPGVILNPDPRAHIRNLKALPTVDAEIDRCIECGFCEPVCPSRPLTLTPRRRIVVRREMARLRAQGSDPVTLSLLERDYQYAGIDTCAADGLCATACPVSIDTGHLIKRLRSEGHSDQSKGFAGWLAEHSQAVETLLRIGLKAAHLAEKIVGPRLLGWGCRLMAKTLGVRMPTWSQAFPEVPALPAAKAPEEPQFIYVPSCLSRMMGKPREQKLSLPELILTLSERAQVRLWMPPDLEGHCCGLPFGSKGFPEAHAKLLTKLVDALWGWTQNGQIPVVTDASSCLYSIKTSGELLDKEQKEKLDRMRVLDVMQYAKSELMPRLPITRQNKRVVLHPTCAARKLDLVGAMQQVADKCASEVLIPNHLSCCATAGDRGLLYPELTAAATAAECQEVTERPADGYYSNNLTCEIGLAQSTGLSYVSLLYLLEEASR